MRKKCLCCSNKAIYLISAVCIYFTFVIYLAANVSAQEEFVIDENGVLTQYTGCASNVIVPDAVTAIGDNAFQKNTNICTVKINNNVKSIGKYAFEGCCKLEKIDLPESVKTIGSYAFSGCNSLLHIDFPEPVTKIDESTCQGCSSLLSVSMSDNVVIISKNAFSNCNSLNSVYLSKSVENIGSCSFAKCTSLTEIEIPKSLKSGGEYSNVGWGYGAFYKCSSLNKVTFEAGTTHIADCLFNGCDGIEEIVIPNTVTSIGVSI